MVGERDERGTVCLLILACKHTHTTSKSQKTNENKFDPYKHKNTQTNFVQTDRLTLFFLLSRSLILFFARPGLSRRPFCRTGLPMSGNFILSTTREQAILVSMLWLLRRCHFFCLSLIVFRRGPHRCYVVLLRSSPPSLRCWTQRCMGCYFFFVSNTGEHDVAQSPATQKSHCLYHIINCIMGHSVKPMRSSSEARLDVPARCKRRTSEGSLRMKGQGGIGNFSTNFSIDLSM